MNLQRGLWRLWLVLTVLWVCSVATISFEPARLEFAKADDVGTINAALWVKEIPLQCRSHNLRGHSGSDYRVDPESNLCWYSLASFRKLNQQYEDVTDIDLVGIMFAGLDVPMISPDPWGFIAERFLWAVCVPIVVLLFGWSLFWVRRGFSVSTASYECESSY